MHVELILKVACVADHVSIPIICENLSSLKYWFIQYTNNQVATLICKLCQQQISLTQVCVVSTCNLRNSGYFMFKINGVIPIDNNNNMSCLPRVTSSVFILFSLRALQSYYYPGHRIQAYLHTMYAHSPLPGEHSASAS